MGLKRRAKAPKYPQGQIGKAGHARSSTKKPKPFDIDPSNPKFGIVGSGRKSVQQLAGRANSLFGTSRATPDGQGRLSSKAKRQVK